MDRSVIRFPTLVPSGKSGVCTAPIGTAESQCPSSAPVACFIAAPMIPADIYLVVHHVMRELAVVVLVPNSYPALLQTKGL